MDSLVNSSEAPQVTNPKCKVVAIAASAGGIDALKELLAGLSPEFPLPILIVVHLQPDRKSFLAEVLGRSTRLRVKPAEHGEVIKAGRVYVAPPNFHLMVRKHGVLALVSSEPVHYVRPAADLLFFSVAETYGDAGIGVILSGYGMDGACGLRRMREKGAIVLAQDRNSSKVFNMPESAIEYGSVDLILPLADISFALETLAASEPVVEAAVA